MTKKSGGSNPPAKKREKSFDIITEFANIHLAPHRGVTTEKI